MNRKPDPSTSAGELRGQAEAKLNQNEQKEAVHPAPEADPPHLIHEPQVHQIELEMQNEALIQTRTEALIQTRTELETALRQYTDLYDFAPVGYCTLAHDGAIQQINLTGATLLGVERGNLIQRRLGLFVAPASRPAFSDFLARVFAGQGKEPCEITLQKEGDGPLWVHLEARLDANQNCRAVLMDITERKWAEEQLRFQATLLNAVEQAVIATDTSGIINYLNSAAESLYGWAADEVLGRNILDVTVPQVSREQAAELLSQLAQGKAWAGEFLVQRRDGSVFPSLVHDSPILDNTGKLIGIIGVSSDITERKQTEAVARESEERLRQVWEATSDAMALSDADGIVLAANPAYFRLYGYTPEEVIGKSFAIIFPEENRKQAVEQYKAVFAGDLRPPPFESTIERRDGSKREVESSVAFLTAAGQRTAMLSTIRDITQRKQAQEETRAQIAELQRWHNATLGREMRVLELKREVNELLGKSGQPPRYPSAEA